MKDKKEKANKKYDKSQIFVKVMAGMLAILMVGATSATLLYALF
jgi:hypothetical protein